MASANMKDIKRRIKSIENTMQITKAMQLVASSKLRKSKEKTEKAIPYFDTLYETMCEITAENKTFESIFMKKNRSNNVLMIVIAGDRGLAGGFNANILKLATKRYEELSSDYNVVVLPIGKKAVEYFEKRNFKIMSKHVNVAEDITVYKSLNICKKFIDAFIDGKLDKVELFYTKYESPLVQEAKKLSILPVENFNKEGITRNLTTYEPSAEEVFDLLIPQYVAGILYGAISDSYTSELAARRLAMENATDNATEMIDNLSLVYNRARQSTITQEITEIVSGANAQT